MLFFIFLLNILSEDEHKRKGHDQKQIKIENKVFTCPPTLHELS